MSQEGKNLRIKTLSMGYGLVCQVSYFSRSTSVTLQSMYTSQSRVGNSLSMHTKSYQLVLVLQQQYVYYELVEQEIPCLLIASITTIRLVVCTRARRSNYYAHTVYAYSRVLLSTRVQQASSMHRTTLGFEKKIVCIVKTS